MLVSVLAVISVAFVFGAGLTPRERAVLALMAAGHSNSALAQHLSITERAVEKHVSAILPSWTCRHRRRITAACWQW